jgi:hypothetical protein
VRRKDVIMARSNIKIAADLERIKERIGANKRALRKTKAKAEELEAEIHSAMQADEHLDPSRKSRIP